MAAENQETAFKSSSKSENFLSKCRKCWKEISERRLKLRTLLLVLCMMSTSMTFCLGTNISLSLTTLPEGSTCFNPIPDNFPQAEFVIPILQNTIMMLLYPLTGWLADTVIGRGRAVRISLWCCWLGSVLYIVSLCMQYGLCGLPVNIAKYGISVLALILIMFGTANSFSNIAPYGQDQLVNKCSSQIRAFIHWVIWGLYLGFFFSYVSFIHDVIYQPLLALITGVIVFLFNSVVLVLFGKFHHKFKPSGVLQKNPYRSIYEVLKYAVYHKSPTNRSALTYWEPTAPSRINFGKEKYGGPFTESEVEDVKVFWRIFGIMVSTFGLHFPIFVVLLGIFGYMNTFYEAEKYRSYFFWTLFDQSILFIIPVMHFIIIPLIPKIDYFLVKSLRNLGALYVLMLIAILSLIVITIVGYDITQSYVPCANFSVAINLSYYWFAIPLFFSGLVGSLRLIFTFEFIISQSPANMSGMLIGAFWFTQAIFLSFGSFVNLPFALFNIDGPGKLSCNFWILLINLLVFIVGFVVYFLCAWKYKKRQREETYYYRNVIEETFVRILDKSTVEVNPQTIRIYEYSTFEN